MITRVVPLLLLPALLLAFATAAAQEFKKTATAGFVFLELPVTARTAAMGEASVALGDGDAEGLFANPAAIGFTAKTHSVSVSYAPWFAEMRHYASSYAYNSPIGVFAASAVVFDFGTMQRTQRSTGQRVYETLGEFSADALSLGLTYARMLTDQFSFGVTVNYVREAIDTESAGNVVFDGGVLYHTGLGSLRLAAAVQHFGTEAKYRNDPFKMPTMMRLGLAAEVLGDRTSEYRLTASVEALHPNDADERVNAGLELAWNDMVVLRGGWKFFTDEESFTFGVGLRGTGAGIPAGVDFAFADYGRLGSVLRFTLVAGWE
jgi:hypothetical protein